MTLFSDQLFAEEFHRVREDYTIEFQLKAFLQALRVLRTIAHQRLIAKMVLQLLLGKSHFSAVDEITLLVNTADEGRWSYYLGDRPT